jgi:hypothetical protein
LALPSQFGAKSDFVVNYKIQNNFLSLLELMPLTKFENKFISTSKPGWITKELIVVYGKIVDEALQ